MNRYHARIFGGAVFIEDSLSLGAHARDQYTIEEARMVARWLNEPRELMNAFDRLYNACANFFAQDDTEPTLIRIDWLFYYQVLRDSPPNWRPADEIASVNKTFMGVPYVLVKNQAVDYILEGGATLQ